jgi:hypothetical protein
MTTLLTDKQAAVEAGVSVFTIRRLCDSGRLDCTDYGAGGRRHKWRIHPEALRNVKPVPQTTEEATQPPPRRRRRRQSASADLRCLLPPA